MAKSAKKDQDTVVVNVTQLFVPVAIVVVGVMISVALYMGLKGKNDSNSDSSGQVAGTEENQDTTDTTDGTEEPTTAVTSIDDDPILGDRNSAKVAIVEFSDYECPYCKRYHDETFNQIVKNYIDTGKAIYVYRDLPLSFHDPAATLEALAAECVQDIGGDSAYYTYHGLLFDNTGSNGEGVGGKNVLANLAAKAGVDKSSFNACLDSEKFKDEIQKDSTDAQTALISGTPGFIIGKLGSDGTVDGTIIRGAYPYSEFQRVLDEALAG